MEDKDTICAVVVTHNRKNLLLTCLDSLLRQVHSLDAIYIIDNASTDGSSDALKEKGYIDEMVKLDWKAVETEKEVAVRSGKNEGKRIRIIYVKMNKNTGGAGGFHEGVKRGYEKGYDWLWLMDDDVAPQDDCLSQLMAEVDRSFSDVLALQPIRKKISGEIINFYPYFSRIIMRTINVSMKKSNTIYFEGTFIGKKLVDAVGFPDKDFFIAFDDVEYGLRISKIAKMRYVKEAFIIRLLAPDSTNNPIKRYYTFRNLFLFARLQHIPMFWAVFMILIQVLCSIAKTALFQQDKLKIIKLLSRAYFDGLNGKFGKIPENVIND